LTKIFYTKKWLIYYQSDKHKLITPVNIAKSVVTYRIRHHTFDIASTIIPTVENSFVPYQFLFYQPTIFYQDSTNHKTDQVLA
jgi:hypothetical protein